MAAPTLKCCMHVCSHTKTNISSFSDTSFAKFKDCVLRWSVLPGIYGALARDLSSKYCIKSSKSLADFQDHEHGESCIGYHRECYQRFTDVNKLRKTEERLAKNPPKDDDSTDDDNDDVEPVCKKRTLRSNVAGPSSSGRPHILPVSCIICHADHWIRDKVTCKRRREPLTRCETIDAGKLREAAELTCNESLILEMRGRDLVASEARYHQSCFRNATRFLTRKLPKETTDFLYAESYAKFCHNVIDEEILKQQGAIRMTKLTAQFIKTVKEVQGIDASSYRSYNLKKRLQGSYPQLQFLRPTRRYESEVVISRTVEAQNLALNLVNLQDEAKSSNEIDTSSCSESDLQHEQKGSCRSKGISLSDMYFTARQLRIAVQEVHVDTAWPQTGQDLTLAIARNLVPVQLYNFLAWLIGASEEPSESERVAVSEQHDRRILSMAQDIIYNSSGGKKSMPKHAALAMTVRHLTGSAKLIGLLNGFGHASSHSVILEHDTALAQKQLDMGPINLPPFIKQREFTTLIWDNNDFGEETLSGSGTTHNTNGIVVQTQQADHSPEDAFCCPPVATKSRSLEPPPTELASYYGGAKKGPSVFGAAIPIHETTDGQVNAMTLDTSYVLSRAIQRESNQHRPPSWTRFNTLIADNIPAKSIIGYLPVIDASPTEMDTIETILCRSLEIANALHLQTIVTVFDQAIYAKAQQIRWKSGPYSSRIIVRLGAFHTAMTFLACLGKRFGDAGLEEVAIASEVVAQGSINGVLNGHHYNRSVRSTS
ncbi:uncharacterized protein [Apostichopus japonicus]|uniref:uncharacterized protein n=1 Tax=Stichopus japonicus TaxID=307972 RepID=UPI003AB862CF